jgi:hypothetical protein
MKAANMTTIAAMEPLLPDDDKGLEELATDLVEGERPRNTVTPGAARLRRRPRAVDELLLLHNPQLYGGGQ